MGTSWTELAFTALGRIDDGLASADASDPRISATGPVEGDTGVAILADVLQRVLTPRATADGDRRPRFRGPRLGDVTLPAVVEANCEWVSAVREVWAGSDSRCSTRRRAATERASRNPRTQPPAESLAQAMAASSSGGSSPAVRPAHELGRVAG
jgi:hypothetical protein